jgi:hypothetical protein
MMQGEARMGRGWCGEALAASASPVRRWPPSASPVSSLRMPGTGGHVGSPFTGDSHCAGQTESPDHPELDRPLRWARKRNTALEILP